ncbi:tetrahydrofolate dehydrogenase/cyclohydrolase catalytic domain-containing protein, partial [Bacteriovoracaceae bacterium]|nr:tetrahydrofolate dehydrogenase/cyclohydrolase catalytic domain-containing protein [Bacteriovoracaceae bacterium]
MSKILASKELITLQKNLFKEECSKLAEKGIKPTMKVILVGSFAPSVIYTRNKKKFIEDIGGSCEIINLDENIKEADFLSEVNKITEDKSVHGCFIQLPLPKQLSSTDLSTLIPPQKDVDGFHPHNLDLLLRGDIGNKSLLPCTPKGIIKLLNHFKIEINGKNVLVIGRSMIVGKPMALLILNHNGTPTIAHSRTSDVKSLAKSADIIISAVGKAKFLDQSWLGDKKPWIIDVGMNHD